MSGTFAERDQGELPSLGRLLNEAAAIVEGLAVQLLRDAGAAEGLFVAGVGWATVELDRAAVELAATVGRARSAAFRPGRPDPLLGAASRLARAADGRWLILLEPTTEGRLAAFLARHGEALAAVYVARAPVAAASPRLPDGPLGRELPDGPLGPQAADGLPGPKFPEGALGRELPDGPLGPQRLLAGGRDGPWVILVHDRSGAGPLARGTIRAMSGPRDPVLRTALPADAPRIAQLLTDEGYPAGPSDILERLARLAEHDGAVIVADVGGEPIGFVAVHRIPRFEHDDQVLRVLALVVEPGVRDRGIGRLLMEAAERLAREDSAAFLEVTAGHHRADARHLFETLGYDASLTTYLRKRL